MDADRAIQFDRVVAEYRDRVYRLAYALLGDHAAAEDAAQEAFVRIWKGLSGFRDEAALSTWIYAIARNACLTYRKRQRPERFVPIENGIEAGAPVAASDTLTGIDLRRALAELPTKYRDVLILYYFEERSYQQVSEALGIPIGTVKTYLHRAKICLRDAVTRRNEGAGGAAARLLDRDHKLPTARE
jgi:RNA polymerase sigma-70 factor (ECF subfamily)